MLSLLPGAAGAVAAPHALMPPVVIIQEAERAYMGALAELITLMSQVTT